MKKIFKARRGVTVMLVLVFMGVFSMSVGMLATYLLTQAKVGRAKYAREQAFSVAEGGLEYYKWFLAHFPNNLTNGTGQAGPYSFVVNDPEGGQIGTASIAVVGNTACGVIQSIDITSEGTADIDSRFKRSLFGRYARSSVAEYSHIINSNVWAGADRNIVGPYHSNGGVRMDGTNNSTVTSGVSTWTCTSSFGCSPNQNVAGVWGAGPGFTLWQYPVPQFNFAGMAVNLATLKGYAQTQGVYFNTVSTSGQRGYHMILRNDNTVDVYRVTGTNGRSTIHIDNPSSWQTDYHQITSETYLGRYIIPAACPVILAEDNIWLEGTAASKIIVIAGDPENASYNPDIILQNNIGYTSTAGTVGLTAVAERSVVYGYNIPDIMTVRGIFVAQTGYYGRNLYPCQYSPYDKRTSLALHGSVVSNGRVGTKWGYSSSGCSNQWSGFNTRTDTYDRLLSSSPPSFTPFATTDFKFTIWREE
ncbi:MAG: pilus assembly PilX N-terminal domain-containing protein [Patescibacteria group bacterium]